VFERFTDRARHVVVLAQEEARLLCHNYIGTEHILLGLLAEVDGIAARALRQLGVGLGGVRRDVEAIIGRGSETPASHIPFTPRAKKVLELSLRESLGLGHSYIGTEHILLGLVREGEGVAAQVLTARGVALDRVRHAVLTQLDQHGPESSVPRGRPPRTPAAEDVVAAAEQLAGNAPVGSHHLLEALARADDSLAAKVLSSLGIDPDALAATIDEIGIDGTTDVTPEESAARRIEVRLSGEEVHVVLRDDATIGVARALAEILGGPVRGDDPVTGSLVGLWQAVLRELETLQRRVAPQPEDAEPSRGLRTALVQRAIQSRLRRRGQPTPE
jgi:ATP-dependent Clp protease ATP-binding subunit ClpA